MANHSRDLPKHPQQWQPHLSWTRVAIWPAPPALCLVLDAHQCWLPQVLSCLLLWLVWFLLWNDQRPGLKKSNRAVKQWTKSWVNKIGTLAKQCFAEFCQQEYCMCNKNWVATTMANMLCGTYVLEVFVLYHFIKCVTAGKWIIRFQINALMRAPAVIVDNWEQVDLVYQPHTNHGADFTKHMETFADHSFW